MKLHAILGRTVFKEIQHVRIERAKRILRDTDMSMDRVAQMSGFSGGGVHLSVEFKKNTGQTPGAYRRQFRQQ